MHAFNNNWLFERERIDNLSKNKTLINKLDNSLKKFNNINIIDLGARTGSNFRYLSKKIKLKNQYWSLIDISQKSLNEVKKNLTKNQKFINLKLINKNIIRDIKKFEFNKFYLVTGSAFLDIMPLNWFKSFHEKNINTKLVYFSINYDGFFQFFPKHDLDLEILNLFNNDQVSKKNNQNKAVGPNCTSIINKFFNKSHKTYSLQSNWSVQNNINFQLLFLAFCENIIKKNNKLKYSNWIEFRKNKIKNNKSKLIVHNKDFLAIKI